MISLFKPHYTTLLCLLLFAIFMALTVEHSHAEDALREIVDARGQTKSIPADVNRVICSGPGCLRLLTYLEAQDMAVAVDDIESRRTRFDARPYALANPHFKELPIFGEFRGFDNPELIVMLEPQPQVIFKTYTSAMGYDPDELESKTGLPVIVLHYGDLGRLRPQLYEALRIMGEAVGRSRRAVEIIEFFETRIGDLEWRTAGIPEEERHDVFLGGVAFKGPHGFQSTEPAYPPFTFVNANNLAYDTGLAGAELRHSDIAKEQIVEWNPDVLFLDLATLQMGEDGGGLHELQTDPAYRTLTAVQGGRVYGVLPYNWYTKNYGSILANAYYIGTVLYPDRFDNIDPTVEADAIYEFLVGKPVFTQMDEMFGGLVFNPVPVQ